MFLALPMAREDHQDLCRLIHRFRCTQIAVVDSDVSVRQHPIHSIHRQAILKVEHLGAGFKYLSQLKSTYNNVLYLFWFHGFVDCRTMK